jgi:ABC-type multidrug transport system permease subunit
LKCSSKRQYFQSVDIKYLSKLGCFSKHILVSHKNNQSAEGAEFVWVSECQKGEGCKTINQFVCKWSPNSVSSVITIVAIRLIATLIFNSMFIWLNQFKKKKEKKDMSSLNWVLNSGPLASKASV